MTSYQTAIEAMPRLLDKDQNALETFNRKNYTASFLRRYQEFVPAFDAIEQLYHEVKEPEAMLHNMAQALTDSALSQMETLHRRGARDNALMNFNMQLAVFVYPAILYYKGDSSKPLSQAIQACWKEAFPKTNVQPAEMEYIEKGFHRKFCYITTAVCTTQGKPDDCYELTLLRDYRDGYLAGLENGEELISRYYDVAPTIVRHINERPEREEIYTGIWDKYLSPCIRMIEDGRNEECRLLYMQMVYDLQDEYFWENRV